jgi:hypothetical protein
VGPASDTADRDPAIPAAKLRQHHWAVIGGIGAFVVLAIFWALVFTGTLTPKNPDRLADRAWVHRTDAQCKKVQDAINRLPNAGKATSAAARADSLQRGSDLLTGLVADVRADQPDTADQRAVVRSWLADWDFYLADRAAYIHALRTEGGSAKPLMRPIHGSTAKQTITDFADANGMGNCEAPLDF